MRRVGACQRCESCSAMGGYSWCSVRCVTGAVVRQMVEMGRDSCVEKTRWATSSSRLATLLAREQAVENRRVRLVGQNGTIAGAMYAPRLVKEVLKTLGKQMVDDGRLDSVSLYSAGPTAGCPELDTQEWQPDAYDQQGNLLDPVKVKGGKREEIDWVLKQQLFGNVPGSECAERQGRPYSLKWVSEEQGRQGQSTTGWEGKSRKPNVRTRSSNRVMCFLRCHQWRD